MLELLFNVLLQLAIVASGTASDAKTSAKTQTDKAITAKTAPTTPPTTGIGSTGWDDDD